MLCIQLQYGKTMYLNTGFQYTVNEYFICTLFIYITENLKINIL